MTVYKDFDAAIAEENARLDGEGRGEPIGIILGGEAFDIATPLPAAGMLHLGVIADMADDPNLEGEPAVVAAAMSQFVQFLESVVSPDDDSRFQAALTRSRASFAILLDIVGHIVTEATGRPLGPSSPSPTSPSPTGPTSKVVSFSEGTVLTDGVPLAAEAMAGASSL